MSPTFDFSHPPPEWRRWIDENLLRGCTDSSMVEQMVHSHIDAATAKQWLNSVRKAYALIPAGAPLVLPDDESPRFPSTGNVIQTPDRTVRVTLRMQRPVLAVLDDMLSADECDELVRMARLKLQPSTIVDPSTGHHAVIDARSSRGTFFSINENNFIEKLDTRIASLMHMPVENGEGLQILNYQVGAEYQAHFDYFPPADPGSAVHLQKGGQRVSTLVIYLNDVDQAGETTFPAVGLSVVPKKGSAVYFEYCNSAFQMDPMTLHAGAPVAAGEKWIATKWMRQNRYG
jgi:prolyl 4-hydroxylase